jgi:hypothetical protein
MTSDFSGKTVRDVFEVSTVVMQINLTASETTRASVSQVVVVILPQELRVNTIKSAKIIK